MFVVPWVPSLAGVIVLLLIAAVACGMQDFALPGNFQADFDSF
jgi:hypothetical protein